MKKGMLLALLWAAPTHAQDVTLWLWHGEHDLRGLHAATEGRVHVAYLSRTLAIDRHRVEVVPRHDAIFLDPETPRTAVVHVEIAHEVSASDLRALEPQILEAIEPVWSQNATGIQIDFDAPLSFRAVYAHLLQQVAARKPPSWRLSMTAIGSWCISDRWLADVPVDSIVPMLFGPGHEREMALAVLRRGPLPEPRCNEALGIREGDPRPPRSQGLFVFRQGRWDLTGALSEYNRLRT